MKRYLVAGLLVWLPLAITLWVLSWAVGLLGGAFDALIGAAQAVLPAPTGELLERIRTVPGLGVVAMIAALLLTGMLAANLTGQWLVRRWHAVMTRIPIVKSIYTSVMQVSDTLFARNATAFREAVLVPYPRQGAWTIAFVTGRPGGEVQQHLAGDWVSVYVPTTPNPTSGFFLMMPRGDIVPLRMSVDEALKYVISMGVVAPPLPPAALARN